VGPASGPPSFEYLREKGKRVYSDAVIIGGATTNNHALNGDGRLSGELRGNRFEL
jgi:hypothetical protein